MNDTGTSWRNMLQQLSADKNRASAASHDIQHIGRPAVVLIGCEERASRITGRYEQGDLPGGVRHKHRRRSYVRRSSEHASRTRIQLFASI